MRIVFATNALSRVAAGAVFAMAFATGFAQQQTTGRGAVEAGANAPGPCG